MARDANGYTITGQIAGTSAAVSGFTVANGSMFNNISKVILPSGAFYDNMSFTAAAVPESTSAALI